MADEVGYDWSRDSPWRRLPWTLPGAFVIGVLCLWAGTGFMPGEATPSPPDDKLPLDAELIELPPPPPPKTIEHARQTPLK